MWGCSPPLTEPSDLDAWRTQIIRGLWGTDLCLARSPVPNTGPSGQAITIFILSSTCGHRKYRGPWIPITGPLIICVWYQIVLFRLYGTTYLFGHQIYLHYTVRLSSAEIQYPIIPAVIMMGVTWPYWNANSTALWVKVGVTASANRFRMLAHLSPSYGWQHVNGSETGKLGKYQFPINIDESGTRTHPHGDYVYSY